VQRVARVVVPGTDKGFADYSTKGRLNVLPLGPILVKVLESGCVDAAEEEVNGLLARLDPTDHRVVILAGADLSEVK
jgi:hypothetical protein